jgi:predicted enzyme related to lactoylglutathione lyase
MRHLASAHVSATTGAVQDIEAAREQLIALGVRVVSDLEGSASAGGRRCYFQDAEGNVFEP